MDEREVDDDGGTEGEAAEEQVGRKAGPGEGGAGGEDEDPEREQSLPVAAVEQVAGAGGGSGPGVKAPVGGVDQPHGEDEEDGREGVDTGMEAAGEQNLPEERHEGRVEAEQIRP